MSLVSDNPYIVESQFQSDGWRDTWRNLMSGKSTPNLDPEPAGNLGDCIQQVHKDVQTQVNSMKQYTKLQKATQYWSSDFKQAKLGLYGCLFVSFGKLYQGHSILHDIYRHETRKPIREPGRVLCKMYECGFATEGEKMWVPKKGNNVLWRIKSYY